MVNEELSWLAAAIDFEGSIMLMKRIEKRCSIGYTLIPVVKIANTNKKLLERFSFLTQAIIGNNEVGKTKLNNKPYYCITMYSNKNRTILPLILPFLIGKKRQAILLLEALDILSKRYHKPYSTRNGRLDEIHSEIKLLNKKGLK